MVVWWSYSFQMYYALPNPLIWLARNAFTQRKIPTKWNKSREPLHSALNMTQLFALRMHFMTTFNFPKKRQKMRALFFVYPFLMHLFIFTAWENRRKTLLPSARCSLVVFFISLLVYATFCVCAVVLMLTHTSILPVDLLRFDRPDPLFGVVNLLTT